MLYYILYSSTKYTIFFSTTAQNKLCNFLSNPGVLFRGPAAAAIADWPNDSLTD